MSPKTDRIAEKLTRGAETIVFTGAGISTESGIPDYRSQGGLWDKFKPVYFDDFMSSRDARIEYWAPECVAQPPLVYIARGLGRQRKLPEVAWDRGAEPRRRGQGSGRRPRGVAGQVDAPRWDFEEPQSSCLGRRVDLWSGRRRDLQMVPPLGTEL